MDTFVRDTINLRLNTGQDISGFSVIKVKYKDPAGTTGEWVAAVCPSNNNYVLIGIDQHLLVNGIWLVQAYVANTAETERYHGDWAELAVANPLYQGT